MTQFQVGDIIERPGMGYREVRGVGPGAYAVGRRCPTIEAVRAAPDNNTLSLDFAHRNYTLVSRPGVTPGEEVKQMTKFNAGDVVQYDADSDCIRVVREVRDTEYVLTGRLSGTYADDRDIYSHSYIDTEYSLLVAAMPTLNVTDAHKADMATLSTKLAEEARRRGWCSEYETVIARFNEDLTIPLDPYPAAKVRTTTTLTVVLRRTDEVTDGTSAADHAYGLAYQPNIDNWAPPSGWETVRINTTDYSGEVIAS